MEVFLEKDITNYVLNSYSLFIVIIYLVYIFYIIYYFSTSDNTTWIQIYNRIDKSFILTTSIKNIFYNIIYNTHFTDAIYLNTSVITRLFAVFLSFLAGIANMYRKVLAFLRHYTFFGHSWSLMKSKTHNMCPLSWTIFIWSWHRLWEI